MKPDRASPPEFSRLSTHPSPPYARRWLAGAALVLLLVALAGAAAYRHLASRPYIVRITASQIDEQLRQAFPISRRYLLLLEVTASDPLVGLEENSDRVKLGVSLRLQPMDYQLRAGQAQKSGRLDLESRVELTAGLRYAPETGGFYLTDPVIDRLDVEGFPEPFKHQADRFLRDLVAAALRTRPVYTLRPADTRTALAKLLLRSVRIEEGEIVAVLGL